MARESSACVFVAELEEPEISVAAMCDVLFVLLTFFMSVTTVDILRTTATVALPDARDAAKLDGQSWVYVDVLWTPGRGGEVWCEEREYSTPELLAPLLSKRVSDAGIKTVYIRADKDCQHHYISRLTKVVADAGISQVVFGTVPTAPAAHPSSP